MKVYIVPIIALTLVAGLELLALKNGINGTALTVAFAAIGGIATGGTMKVWQRLKDNERQRNKPDTKN
tara:strand:- start:1579 stop:1782 length:204 start_codon:yes stop_codon:yes gene_type:complete